MGKILVFAGKRQAGKNTCANVMHGLLMKKYGYIEQFFIDNEGDLLVNTVNDDGEKGLGCLSLVSAYYNQNIADYLSYSGIWQKVKLYHFADELKMSVHKIFNIPLDKLYGTNKDKEEPSPIKWSDFVRFLHPKKVKQMKDDGLELDSNMSIRDLLQYFGTEICRGIYDNCWIDSCLRKIEQENPDLAVIADCRFPNEAIRAKECGAQVIKLNRNLYQSNHSSESALDDYKDFDAIIDNQNYTINQTATDLEKIVKEWNLV